MVACGGDDALTNRLGFPAGSTVENGTPAEPTFQAGDVSLTTPTTTDTLDSNTGSGSLAVTFQSMPANTDFDVNVRFGTGTSSVVKIPISQTVTSGATAGTLTIPFTVPPSICDNVADIQRQITCYETIDVGNGMMVSQATARQMILVCSSGGGFAT